jgi:hypothetical protein
MVDIPEARAYRVMLAVTASLTCQHVTMDIRKHYMVIDSQLGLEGALLAIAKQDRLDVR